MPDSDPVHPILAAILRVVPASRWAFARIKPDDELGMVLGSHADGDDLEQLRTEFERHGGKAKTGARIAATLRPLGDFESGVTLLFADAHANLGILVLLRTLELGPFTSSEISVLTLALDATSERLSALPLNGSQSRAYTAEVTLERVQAEPHGSEASDEAFYVLDHDLRIVLAWSAEDQRRIALTGVRTRLADRLPVALEETVRDLVADWQSNSGTRPEGVAHPVPFLVVRTQPMSGPAGLFIGVRIDRSHLSPSLARRAESFHISPRELQVLALLLDGAKLEEIGRQLHITSSTIQDHIQSMVRKTGSRNRTELIARVLGWKSASTQ